MRSGLLMADIEHSISRVRDDSILYYCTGCSPIEDMNIRPTTFFMLATHANYQQLGADVDRFNELDTSRLSLYSSASLNKSGSSLLELKKLWIKQAPKDVLASTARTTPTKALFCPRPLKFLLWTKGDSGEGD